MPRKKVLVLDESERAVDKLKLFFTQQLGFDVVAVSCDGSQAVTLYREYRPDLITLDIMMPGMDGVSTLAELLKEDAGATIMMVSAVRGEPLLQCMVLGARGHVEKPLDFDNTEYVGEFIGTIREILGKW